MRLFIRIVLCIVVVEILGGLGGYLTAKSIGDWYARLEAPPGTPPNAVFGPVWAILYAAMGTAFALVWHRAPAGRPKHLAISWFGFQLALNLAWTPVFFGAHLIDAALIVILCLLAAIARTIRLFFPISRPAAWLMVPYAAWVAYATYLNAGFSILNR